MTKERETLAEAAQDLKVDLYQQDSARATAIAFDVSAILRFVTEGYEDDNKRAARLVGQLDSRWAMAQFADPAIWSAFRNAVEPFVAYLVEDPAAPTAAETIARTPIATVIANLPQGLSSGSAADRVLAAIREQGLVIVDPKAAR